MSFQIPYGKHIRSVILAALLLFAFCAMPTFAQGLPSETLKMGTWRFGVQEGIGGGSNHVTNGIIYWLTGLQIGLSITPPRAPSWGRGNWEYSIEIVPAFFVSQGKIVRGIGVNPVYFRRTFTHWKTLAPFFESDLGLLFFDSNVPPGKTFKRNIAVQAGGGVYAFTRPRRAVSFALKFIHISNGGAGHRNPGINGVHFTVGYHWFK